eukprot:TRINITY_DN660_c0_g1_i1.p1 TRINITY_DN660_c0_g1~~TRINITY_DN660_c0_g1_i1.p1  ORF type:complete len:1113 (+),score=203.35 TRINITY_DN660_c0_g1_i1:335-3673(+)
MAIEVKIGRSKQHHSSSRAAVLRNYNARRGNIPPSTIRQTVILGLLLLLFGLLSASDVLIRVVISGLGRPKDSVYDAQFNPIDEGVDERRETYFPGLLEGSKDSNESSEKGGRRAGVVAWRETRIEAKESGTALEDVLKNRIQKALREKEDAVWAAQPFQLHIQFLGGCDNGKLMRGFKALHAAEYGGDRVRLTVVTNCTATVEALQHFSWSHGTLHTFYTAAGEADQVRLHPMEVWYPTTDAEHLFVIAAYSKLAPGFYSALKAAAFLHANNTSPSPARRGASRTLLGKGRPRLSVNPSLFGLVIDPRAPPLTAFGGSGGLFDGSISAHWAAGKSGALMSATMASGCQLLFPAAWRAFRAWHAEAQAPQSSSGDVRYDAEAYDFSAPCRSDWLASHLTYVTEMHLFNLYAAPMKGNLHLCIAKPERPVALASSLQAAAAVASIAPMASLRALPRFDHCGRKTSPGVIITNSTKLKDALAPLVRDGALVGVMVSPGYDDMLTNWLCYAKELALQNFFLITQDGAQAERLRQRGLAVYLAGVERHGKQAGAPLDYGSVAYKKFILARTAAIGEILHAGYHVLLADVDAVWFADPFPHFKEPKVDMFAQLEERGNPCGGFLYLLSTPTVLSIWDLITAMFTEHVSWLEAHPSKKHPTEYAAFLQGQKHNHEQKFLEDILQQGRHHVRLRGLDPLLFINGRDYFDHKDAQMEGIVPVMIHNNYIVGKANKTHRFQIKGMWRVDLAGHTCKCLSLSCKAHPAPWAKKPVILPDSEIRSLSAKAYDKRTVKHLDTTLGGTALLRGTGGQKGKSGKFGTLARIDSSDSTSYNVSSIAFGEGRSSTNRESRGSVSGRTTSEVRGADAGEAMARSTGEGLIHELESDSAGAGLTQMGKSAKAQSRPGQLLSLVASARQGKGRGLLSVADEVAVRIGREVSKSRKERADDSESIRLRDDERRSVPPLGQPMATRIASSVRVLQQQQEGEEQQRISRLSRASPGILVQQPDLLEDESSGSPLSCPPHEKAFPQKGDDSVERVGAFPSSSHLAGSAIVACGERVSQRLLPSKPRHKTGVKSDGIVFSDPRLVAVSQDRDSVKRLQHKEQNENSYRSGEVGRRR